MSEERLSVRLMWAGVALFVVVVAAFFGPAIVQRASTPGNRSAPGLAARRPRSRRDDAVNRVAPQLIAFGK
jgi:hypothetical protein